MSECSGKLAEDFACQYLKKQGLSLLERNYRCRFGEIDLIMRNGEKLVFVEVRLRNHRHKLTGVQSIDYHKQQKLIKTAEIYLQQHNPYHSCQFDVMDLHQSDDTFKVSWVQNAFNNER